jgi:hypothetical protein
MQKESKNKAMGGSEVDIKVEPMEQDYFFPGGGEYVPQTIKATSREDAEGKWEKSRVKVEN